MQLFLQNVAIAAIGAMAGEFCLCILPEGSTRRFCRFVTGVALAVALLLPPLKAGESWVFPEIPQQAEQSEEAEPDKSYEEIIWDVYNAELENKNK